MSSETLARCAEILEKRWPSPVTTTQLIWIDSKRVYTSCRISAVDTRNESVQTGREQSFVITLATSLLNQFCFFAFRMTSPLPLLHFTLFRGRRDCMRRTITAEVGSSGGINFIFSVCRDDGKLI